MAANFDRWENDPFFSAAEEVQESTDRMESAYRTWLNSLKSTSTEWNREDLSRDLSAALDTAKWQLEEFERAVQSSYSNSGTDEAKGRHSQFVLALEGKISVIQNSLQESADPGVGLDEGECDELALFLSGSQAPEGRMKVEIRGKEENAINGKLFGHRRTSSACADIGSWNITISEDESVSHSCNGQVRVLPRRVPSLSALLGTVESVLDRPQEDDVALLRSQPQNRGTNSGYERDRNCLESCDDCYDKQLYGWYGALHRMLQRLLYQVQYVRSMQITVSATLLIFLFVLFLVCIF